MPFEGNTPFQGPPLLPPDAPLTEKEIDSVKVIPNKVINIDDAGVIRAKRLEDLIASGDAEEMTVKEINRIVQTTTGRKLAKNIIKDFKLDADLRRELVRAAVNKTILENLEGMKIIDAQGHEITLPPNYKILLDAAKLASQDPEVGINTAQPIQIGIQIGPELNAAFDIDGVVEEI